LDRRPEIKTKTDVQRTSKLNYSAKTNIEIMFQKYTNLNPSEDEDDDEGDYLKNDGILKFAQDLGIDIDKPDPSLLLIAWKLGVKGAHAFEFSREEFTRWDEIFSCRSIEDMKVALNDWKRLIDTNKSEFKKFYNFVFIYLRETKTVLPLDEAINAWDSMNHFTKWPLYPKWKNYLESTQVKSISNDLWKLLLDFSEKCVSNLNQYQENDMWPSQIDGFVEWDKKQSKK